MSIDHDQHTEPIATDDNWDTPDTCQERGGNCSKIEHHVCLAELDEE